MILDKSAFPVTIQAYEITDGKEFFIAEQVVNTQQEADVFSARYAGKVIKAKALTSAETGAVYGTTHKRKRSGVSIFLVVVIILIILIIIGFYTGWIQRTLGINA